MAQIVTLADDLDKSTPADTYTFYVSGKGYQIDLNEENAEALDALVAEFEEKMGRFIAVARPLGKSSAPSTKSSSSSTSTTDAKAVRAWAQENGIEVSERGRIPKELLEKYNSRKK